jgi:hypothetical protein
MQLLVRAAAAALSVAAGAASADPISWNTWSSETGGSIAAGPTIVAVGFTTANPHSVAFYYPSWTPAATWADGAVVDNAPTSANHIMHLEGGTGATNTISFSTPVVNPVVAIWSLGSSGDPASFVFAQTPTFVAGGPSAEYGGSPITVAGNTVSGREGNGTVRFLGTFSSLSFVNPQFEGWYGFNVGIAAAVPEPAPALLLAAGLAAVGAAARRRR